jgi:hypothetical protein
MHKYRAMHSKGMLLIDALMALFLGAVFVVIITDTTDRTRRIFDFAQERNRLFDVYEAHAGEFEALMPGETKELVMPKIDITMPATTTIYARAKWYGNDRIETDITISTEPPFDQSVTFVAVRNFPFTVISQAVGTPLCSVNFAKRYSVGSYGFLHPSSRSDQKLPLVPRIVPITLPINPLLPLTDIEVRNGIAYISSDSNTASDPDLYVIDIRNATSATSISSINTGPGIASIVLAGKRVFAAATSMVGQLHIIRYDTLAKPTIEMKFRLPLPYATATPPLASSIFYLNNQVYLGTEKWDGPEFSIFDVMNPANPILVGIYETGTKINDIYIRNSDAYVATADEKQMRKLTISDLHNVQLIDSISPSGWERQEGNALSYFEDTLRLGRTSGGFNITKDHELFSWGTSTTVTRSPLLPAEHSSDIPGGIYGIIPDRTKLFLATRQLNKEVQIIDPDLSTSTAQAISLPVLPQTINCDGNKLYVLAKSAPVIYQITF